jgi:DNA mismatch endonuclease (patch repair protein)
MPARPSLRYYLNPFIQRLRIIAMDTVSKKTRSHIMSRIRGKDTKCEVLLRKALFAAGVRGYKKNARVCGFGTDIILPGKKVAIFCDSDFWHCRKRIFPKSNRAYWVPKLKRNKARDTLANKTLRRNGWRVIRLWEKDILKNPKRASRRVIETLRA